MNKKQGRSFWDLVAESQDEKKPAEPFNPAAAMEGLDQMVEVLTGFRERLLSNGFSPTAAEQMAVQLHAGMLFANHQENQ